MSSAKIKPLGLRTQLALWSSLVLAVSLIAGFAWVHFGLRSVLDARNDAFLERKAAELLASVTDHRPGGTSDLEAEIGREVLAYEPEGLIVVVRQAGRVSVAPLTVAAQRLAEQVVPPGVPRTVGRADAGGRYRVLATPSQKGDLSLELGISLTETEATLAAFDRFVGGGAAVFLILAIAGGLFLSRQALRPVAESIRAARRLDPENLSERLPRTGAGDELDELAATINELLDRLAAYHAQIIRFTADASHELRGPLGAMLRVKDTGIGIPAVHLPHLFERFHQADPARSSGGCGLGLSICRWIVKAHGGTIEARNGEVNGAEFTVVLPLENVTSSRPETDSIIANSGELKWEITPDHHTRLCRGMVQHESCACIPTRG
jgi:signal transduction histidine kinase